MAVLKARISGAWVPVGGGPSGGGTDEVVISATEPPLAETELWYDTSAPSTPFGLTANPNNALGIVAIGSFPSGTIAVTPGTPVDLTNPLSVTLLAGRRYRVSVFFRATTTGAGSIILTDNGPTTYPGTGDLWSWAAGNYGSMYVFWLLQGDGAAHELRVRAAANGQALMSYYGDTGSAFYVEDIGPTGSPALPIPTTPPAWIPVTFENGWQNYPGGAFAPGSYRKIGDEVQLRGLVMGGTVNTPICTLPVGFRPAVSVPAGAAIHQPVVSNAAFGWVHVYGSGVLNATSVSNGWVDLCSIRFSVTP